MSLCNISAVWVGPTSWLCKIASYLCLASVIFVGPAIRCYKYACCLNCQVSEAFLIYLIKWVPKHLQRFYLLKINQIQLVFGLLVFLAWGIKRYRYCSSLFVYAYWYSLVSIWCFLLLHTLAPRCLHCITFFSLVKVAFGIICYNPYVYFWHTDWMHERFKYRALYDNSEMLSKLLSHYFYSCTV